MDQARLQGSNLGCSQEGREILASVQSLRSAPSVRGCVQAEYLLLTEAGTAHTSHIDHKVALLSEESSMYMNFIDWIARTSRKKKKKTYTELTGCRDNSRTDHNTSYIFDLRF
jgi:hypothetical protein